MPALLLCSTASAQTITPLVVEGDVLPHGVVTATYNSDVNDSGDWLVECDTDNSDSTKDNAVVFNGTMIHQEGTSLGFPASHASNWVYGSSVDSMDINDNGDRLISMRVKDSAGVLPDKNLVLWTSGTTGMTFVLVEEDVTPCTIAGEPAGAVYDSIAEVWQNNSNTVVIAARSNTDSDDFMAVLAHDGAGNILSQTSFIIDNVVHSVAYPGSTGTHADTVQTIENSKREFAINNAGMKMFHVDDQSFGPGGSPDYTAVDSHYYIDLQEIMWEANDAPTAGTFVMNHMSSAEVDINDNGDWVAAWDDDNPDTSMDGFILVNGAIFAQEGQPAPIGGGFVLEGVSFNNGGVQISDTGAITWTAEWNDPDTSRDKGLYRDMDLLVQEGVTTIGGLAVTDVRTSQSGDDMAVSDNGRFITKELHVTGNIEGVYLIEVALGTAYCFGDGIGTACPCSKTGGPGEGCANSTGAGAVLEGLGSASIAAGDLVLSASGCPANQPGLMFQGTLANNGGLGVFFGDGLRCAGGTVVRLQTVAASAGGEASTSVNIASKGAVSIGDTRFYQFWYRDPSGSPCGSFFNLSNGLEITWSM